MTHLITALDEHFATWAASLGWPTEALLRMGFAAVAGGLVGLEREVRGREAGFRTNLLVCLGSALAMLVSITFAARPWHANGSNINVDPARIAYSVMTGIGFIGAGTIIKFSGSIRGLTTAAAMWCVAAVGLAAGFGMYTVTVMATVLIVGALWILEYVGQIIPRTHYRGVVVRRPWKPGCIDETVRRMEATGVRVVDLHFERHDHAMSMVDVTLHIAFVNREQYYRLERDLEQDENYQLLAIRES